MKGITGYKYDIFISYAHLDDYTISNNEEGWVAIFHQHLELSLNRRYGTPGAVKIWRAPHKLDGTMGIDPVIEQAISNSAVLLCLSSHASLKSAYCQLERKLFYEKANNDAYGLEVGQRYRILNVLINNFNHQTWPAEFKGRLGFTFHDAEHPEAEGEPVPPTGQAFKTHLRTLTKALHGLLSQFVPSAPTASMPPPVAQVPPQGAQKPTIYLAETCDSLRRHLKRTSIELQNKGYTILPSIPPTLTLAEHEQQVKTQIAQADVTVHLLDQYPGREIIDAPETFYVQEQAQIALEKYTNQFIWVPNTFSTNKIEEPQYRQFIDDVESCMGNRNNCEFIKGMRSSLTRDIEEFAANLKQPAPPINTASLSNLKVLIDTHFIDQLDALELSKQLLANKIQPYINPQEDDPRKNLSLLAERVNQVSTLIFFYGKVTKEWVEERVKAILQLIITDNLPVEAIFILLFPERKNPGDITFRQRFLKVDVLDNSDCTTIKKNNLQHLITAIKATHT